MTASILSAFGDVLTSEAAYVNALTFAVFLAFGATGEWVAEKSGTLNISLEGMFLAGAFGAAMGMHQTGSELIAVLAGMASGLAVAFVQAQMSHRLVANQFVVGLTLNILVLGLTSFLASELNPVTQKSSTQPIPLLSDIPLIGAALFDRSWLFYLIYPLVPTEGGAAYHSGGRQWPSKSDPNWQAIARWVNGQK